jgi:uridine phosphorylase
MVFAGRVEGEFIDPSVVAVLEPAVGKACLDAVIAFEIPEKVSTVPACAKMRIDNC